MAFTFIHAADVHLDSPFRGVSGESPEVAGVLRSATFEAYAALVDLCIERKAGFLLVAGDVYDGADRSLPAQLRFRDGLERLDARGIRSFVVHGNHDPLDGWASNLSLPASALFFGGKRVETALVEVEGTPVAAVSGISYPSRRETRHLAGMFHPEHPELFQIALLHCNCGGNQEHEPYAPCVLGDLIGAGFDYWALGHVHAAAILNRHPHVVYPGNVQGRSIREPGPRGCYVISVDDDRNVVEEFCPLDRIRWFVQEISIEGLDSVDELEKALRACLEGARQDADGHPALCRITLVGRGPLFRDLNQADALPGLLERLREEGTSEEPFVWVEKLKARCGPPIDLEQRRGEGGLLGKLLAIAGELRARGDLESALAEALGPLHGHTEAAKALDALAPERYGELLRDAETLCADLLEAAP